MWVLPSSQDVDGNDDEDASLTLADIQREKNGIRHALFCQSFPTWVFLIIC